jgi:hypothetical protein
VEEDRLRRGDHPEAGGPAQMVRGGEAQVLDPVTHGAASQLVVDVDDLLDGDVPDGVDGNAETGVMRHSAERQQLRVLEAKHASRVGVAVGNAQRRGGAAQATVGEELDRVDAQVIGEVRAEGREPSRTLHHPADHHVHPARQPLLRVHPPIGVQEGFVHAGVVGAGDAERELVPEGRVDHRGVVVTGRHRHGGVQQPHRVLVHQPGRGTGPVPLDHAASRGRRGAGDPGGGEGGSIAGHDVAAGAGQDDRAAGDGGIEVPSGRGSALGEAGFVPPAPEQPRPLGAASGFGPEQGTDGGDRPGLPEVDHGGEEVADLPDVGVGVIEPGNQGAPPEVHPPGCGAGEWQDVLVRAHRGDPPVADGEGRGARTRGVLGEQDPAVEDQVGHAGTARCSSTWAMA